MSEGSAARAGTHAPTAERKFLTLLFADLSGYTRLTSTRDPEDVLHAVGPLLSELCDTAAQHGGYVPSVQGDGFMAVFGVPVAHTDDPTRAIAAALAMQDVVVARRKTVPDVPGMHIGIASGEVLVTSHADEHAVIGPAVNLAARLSDAAESGEVLVDEVVAELTATSAVYGAARSLTLHGFAGVVRALPLERTETSPIVRGPLAGRKDQLRALDQALERVPSEGRSHVNLVVGEPGTGKTHLLESWLSQTSTTFVLRGSCRPYGSAWPLSALTEAILLAPVTGDAPLHAAFLQLLPRQRSVDQVGREPDEALHVAARRLLQRVAEQGGTVLLLEDLHWADDALREVLRSLQEEPLPGELLVVGSSREPLDDLPHQTLATLTAEEIREVVSQRLGVMPDAALLELLVERSGGNALWLVECLSLLRDRGQLRIDGSTASVVESEDAEVPASIRMLVAARMDALQPSQKRALQRASVHPGYVLETAERAEVETHRQLANIGLLVRGADGRLRFAHGLVREAVYRSVPRAARVEEHEHVLASATDPAVIAYSAREVQRLDVSPTDERRQFIAARALEAVTAHAKHLRTSHTRAARDVLQQALELCAELDVVAPHAAAVLLTELAEVLRDLEDVERSRHAATRAVAVADICGDPNVQGRALLAQGESWLGSDNTRARSIAERALDFAQAPSALRGRALTLLARSHAYDEPTALLRWLGEAYECFHAAGEQAKAAETARSLAFNLSLTADSTFDHWLAIATTNTAPEHLRGQGELALVRAVVAQARGDWEESWQTAESAMELLERSGMHQSMVNAAAVAVEAATATGRRTALPGLLSRLMTLVADHRPRLRITALCAAAPAYTLLGQEAEADRALDAARTLLPSVGPNEEAMVRVAEGHCAALAGRYREAETAFSAAEQLTTRLDFRLLRLACRLERLQMQAAQGGEAHLRSRVEQLADELDEAGAKPYAERARALALSLSK